MTHNHPVWFRQNRESARGALAKLGKTPEARLAKAATEREKDYLRTLDVLFGDGDKKARDFKYAEAIAKSRSICCTVFSMKTPGSLFRRRSELTVILLWRIGEKL